MSRALSLLLGPFAFMQALMAVLRFWNVPPAPPLSVSVVLARLRLRPSGHESSGKKRRLTRVIRCPSHINQRMGTSCKRDEGINVLPSERKKKRTPRKPQYFSATLDRWDTNGNGEISCREAKRQGIAPIPPSHPAWHYAPGQHRSPTYTRTGRVMSPDNLPPRSKCCGRLGGCRAQERPPG